MLTEAKEANCPVVLLDRGVDAPQDLYLTSVASDQVHERTVGSSPAINRKKGFDEAVAKTSNIKIIRSQTGEFTRSKAKEVMEGFLKAENGGASICAVYAHNDDMAAPAFAALGVYLNAGTVPEKFIITESKLYTPADDPQGEYDRHKGLGY